MLLHSAAISFSCAKTEYQIIYQFKRIYVRLQYPWWCAINGWTMMVIKMCAQHRDWCALEQSTNSLIRTQMTASRRQFCCCCCWDQHLYGNLMFEIIEVIWFENGQLQLNDDHLKMKKINFKTLPVHWGHRRLEIVSMDFRIERKLVLETPAKKVNSIKWPSLARRC